MKEKSSEISSNIDNAYMYRAIQLAQLGIRNCYPNPMVGAVIVYEDKIIGEGYHKQYGEAHAEVNAIHAVKDKSLLKEATIYVSLEPCAHTGKTPPCSDLLIKHQFKRVVIGCNDVFSEVNGKGIEKLKANNIQVDYPVLEKECIELNKRFFTFHQKKRPYIILKWAETQDGFIDKIRQGEKGIFKITGEASQVQVHQMRSEEHAILVGWKTINNDNPSLTTRKVTGQNPIRIILDAQLNADPNAKVFNDGVSSIVMNTIKNEQKKNINYVKCDMKSLDSILEKLHQLNILSCIVEGGATTLNHFISSNLWDEAHQFVGSKKLGNGVRVNRIKFAPIATNQYGEDVCMLYKNEIQ